MAFTSSHTGAQIEQSVTNALALASTLTTVVINGQTYNVLWEIAPTSSNQVYGLSVNPDTGKLYRIYNNKGTYSAEAYSPNSYVPSVSDTTLQFTLGNIDS